MKKLVLILAFAGTSACASSGVTPANKGETVSVADRAAVIAVVEGLFEAMRARDSMAIKAAFVPNTQLVSIETSAGAAQRVRVTSVSAFATSVGRAPNELVERMWSPRVEIAGDMASLWAPYDFRIGGEFSHCGHDSVQLVRTSDGWKVAGLVYTIERTGCAAN